jgi:hypothetical protein
MLALKDFDVIHTMGYNVSWADDLGGQRAIP